MVVREVRVATRRTRGLAAVAVGAVLAGILTACSGPLSPTFTPPASEPSPTSEKVALNCNLLLSDSDVAAMTPPLHPIPTFSPAAGTLASRLLDHGGQPGGWGGEPGASVQVVVAIPFASELRAAKAAAASGQAIDLPQ